MATTTIFNNTAVETTSRCRGVGATTATDAIAFPVMDRVDKDCARPPFSWFLWRPPDNN